MRRYTFIFLSLILAVTLTGCDLVDSIKDSFTKKKDKAASQETAAPKPVNITKPLAANVLARVGNWTLTKDEFEERLKALKEVAPDYDITDPKSRRMVLDELIRQELIVMDAEKSGLAKEKDIVSAVSEFRRTLLVREAARKITGNITVTDEEAKDFYDKNKDQIVQPYQYHVSEIVVPDEVKANEIYVNLLKGGDFAEAARTNSTADSASAGGDMGFLKKDPFPAMVDAILALKEGGISNVFKGPDGYYIVKLDEKKGGQQLPFSQVKDDIIRNRTLFKQQQAILNYVNGLRDKVKIDINEKLLQ